MLPGGSQGFPGGKVPVGFRGVVSHGGSWKVPSGFPGDSGGAEWLRLAGPAWTAGRQKPLVQEIQLKKTFVVIRFFLIVLPGLTVRGGAGQLGWCLGSKPGSTPIQEIQLNTEFQEIQL